MFRKLSVSFLILLFLSCITICSADSSTSNRIEEKNGETIITIKLLRLHSDPPYPAIRNSFKKSFGKIFAKKYKNLYKSNPKKYGKYNWEKVKVKIEKYSGPKIEGVETNLLALASENALDIVYVNCRSICNYIQNGFIQPLDSYYKTLTKKQLDEYVGYKFKPVCYQKGPDGKQHWWTMPFGGKLGKCVAFNKKIFKKHNIPYPDKNWTWKDFLRICRKTTDISKKQYGLRLGRGIHESWYWTSFLWSAGGKVAAYNPKLKKWEYVFDSDAAVKALDFYTQLCTEKHKNSDGEFYRGYTCKNPKDAYSLWTDGKIAMMFAYTEEIIISSMDINKNGLVPIPLGPSGIRHSELNSRMFGLSHQVKNPVIRDTAWEYILYMNSSAVNKIWVDYGIKKGVSHSINPKYLKRFDYEKLIKKSNRDIAELYNTSIKTGVVEPYQPITSNLYYKFMTPPIQYAEKLALEDKLHPVGSEKRHKQLKRILFYACQKANKENDQILAELNKK